MAIPNYKHIVTEIANASGNIQKKSEDLTGVLTRRVAAFIYWNIGDKNFGLLKKKASQTNYLGCAIDCLLHRPTGVAIDIITNSGTDKAEPAWQVYDRDKDIRYTDADWVQPPIIEYPENENENENDPADDAMDLLKQMLDELKKLSAHFGVK